MRLCFVASVIFVHECGCDCMYVVVVTSCELVDPIVVSRIYYSRCRPFCAKRIAANATASVIAEYLFPCVQFTVSISLSLDSIDDSRRKKKSLESLAFEDLRTGSPCFSI